MIGLVHPPRSQKIHSLNYLCRSLNNKQWLRVFLPRTWVGASDNMDRTASASMRFNCLATPFCSGTVSSCQTPPSCSPETQWMCTHHHYPYAGLLLFLWLLHQSFFHSRKCWKTWFLRLRSMCIHTWRVLSLMKVRKYLAPLSDCAFIIPHTSLCSRPSDSVDRL